MITKPKTIAECHKDYLIATLYDCLASPKPNWLTEEQFTDSKNKIRSEIAMFQNMEPYDIWDLLTPEQQTQFFNM